MAERSLRGTRLGALSLETDEHVVPSERQITTYECPNGHKIELPFSVEAEIPATWECRCGAEARLVGDGPEPEAKAVKHQRTHGYAAVRNREGSPNGTRRRGTASSCFNRAARLRVLPRLRKTNDRA